MVTNVTVSLKVSIGRRLTGDLSGKAFHVGNLGVYIGIFFATLGLMTSIRGRVPLRNASTAVLRRTRLALFVVAFGSTQAQASDSLPGFVWPENPFALTLSDHIFVATEEARLEKAGRVFVDSMSGIGDEVTGIFTYPVRDPLTFGAYALGVGALTLVDRPLTAFYQDHVVPAVGGFDLPKPQWVPGWMSVDQFYVGAAVAGTYAYGLAANDERSQVAALLTTKAIAYSYLTSHVLLKAGFGRLRPVPNLSTHTGDAGDYSTSPFDWFVGNGINFNSVTYGTAMPSFHFTMYFAMARVYSGVYDNYLIPYAAAAALALNSAEGHNHWASDMVAGALIGTGIGNLVLNNYEDRKLGHTGILMPVVTSESVGLQFQISF